MAGPLLARGGRGVCGGGVPLGSEVNVGGGVGRGGWQRRRPRLAAGGGGRASSNRSDPRRAERLFPEARSWCVAGPCLRLPGPPARRTFPAVARGLSAPQPALSASFPFDTHLKLSSFTCLFSGLCDIGLFNSLIASVARPPRTAGGLTMPRSA